MIIKKCNINLTDLLLSGMSKSYDLLWNAIINKSIRLKNITIIIPIIKIYKLFYYLLVLLLFFKLKTDNINNIYLNILVKIKQ